MTVTLRRSIVAGGVAYAAGTRWRVDRTFGHKVRISSCGRVLYVRMVDVEKRAGGLRCR